MQAENLEMSIFDLGKEGVSLLKELVNKEKDAIISWRRQIHQNPELGFEEEKTSALVEKLLGEFGYEVQTGFGGTGVVGLLSREEIKDLPAVALRADMDALPITEKNQVPYKSQRPGVMHACGHDGHTAILLGAAKVLSQVKESLKRPVVVVFQPAEERLGGAREVIASGLFQKYNIGEIYGLHLWPPVPEGKVGLKAGPVMAGALNFKLKILGQNAHAAEPHNAVDAIVAGAAVVEALQTVVSRFSDPLEPLVVSVGTFHAGELANIIAGSAELTGTCRTASPAVYRQLPALLARIIENTVRAYGAEPELEIEEGYPVTESEAGCVDKVKQAALVAFGPEAIYSIDKCFMGSEDFSYYLQNVPGAYFFLGIGPERKLHQSTFDFNEELLAKGAELLAQIALLAG